MIDLNTPVDKQSAAYQHNLLKSARTNLLVAVLFTALNVVMLLTGSNRYFLFSTTIPYYLTFFGYMFDHFMVSTYTLTGLTMAVVPVAVWLLCWYLSKKDSRWLMAATVLFGVDTLAMALLVLWSGDVSASLLEILFHVWVMICLVRGVRAAGKLKSCPSHEEPIMETPDSEEELSETENTVVDTDCTV